MGPPGFDFAEELIIISQRQLYKQGEFNLNGNEQINANMSVVHSILNGSNELSSVNTQADLEYAA